MKLVKLTTAAHPDLNDGKPSVCFIAPERVVEITLGSVSFAVQDSLEKIRKVHIQAVALFKDSTAALENLFKPSEGDDSKKNQEKMFAMERWEQAARDFNLGLKGMLDGIPQQAEHYPRVPCTIVRYGTTVPYDYTWGCLFVSESPEEVARLINEDRMTELRYRSPQHLRSDGL